MDRKPEALKINFLGFSTYPYALGCAFTNINSLNCSRPGPGSAIEVTLLICQILEIDCIFKDQGYVAYGTKHPDGTFDGLVGALASGKYNVSLPVLTPTFQRRQVVGFSRAITTTTWGLLLKRPSTQGGSNDDAMLFVYNNFHHYVWILIITAILLTVSLMHLYNVQSTSLIRTFTETMGVLLGQGSLPDDNSWKKRVLILTWALFCLLLISFYSASLVSGLVAPGPALAFNDLQSLVYFMDTPAGRNYRIAMETASNSIIDSLGETAGRNRFQDTFVKILKERPIIELPDHSKWISELKLNPNLVLMWDDNVLEQVCAPFYFSCRTHAEVLHCNAF